MKKIFSLLVLLTAFGSRAQITETLNNNAIWYDDNHRDWCDKGLGTCLMNHNGILMAFNYQGNGTRNGGHAYMYQINKEHYTTPRTYMDDYKVGPEGDCNNRITFGFPGEGSSYDEGPVLGRTFSFKFNGTDWFFMHIRSAHQDEHSSTVDNESYECYAEMPGDNTRKCYTYYSTIKPVSTVLKLGAFQIDSMMYFIAVDYTTVPYHIVIQEYSYNELSNKFINTGNVVSPGNTLHLNLGNVITRIDSLGAEYALATFYDQYGRVQFGKFMPGVHSGKRTFTWVNLGGTGESPFTIAKVGASCIAQGSARGSRDAASQTCKSSSDRVFLFGEEYGINSDGTYHVQYLEYRVEKENYILHAMGSVNVPASYGPQKVAGYYPFLASFELFPLDYTTEHTGIDGFKQYIWLVYPDKNRHFHGVMFESDQWRYIKGSKVESSDLDNDDPVHGYAGISSLWNLTAILDGSPPVSIDWQKWDLTFLDPTPATSMKLISKEGHKTEFNNITSNEWNIGAKISPLTVKGHKTKGCSAQLKYSFEYETQYATATEKTVTYEQPVEMFESTQENGRFLYIVPSIRRFSYCVYPWWDGSGTNYPVPGTFQYQFVTFDQAPLCRGVSLKKFPFNITEPNETYLNQWKLSERDSLYAAIYNNSLDPVVTMIWETGSNGPNTDLEVVNDTTTVTSYTNSWAFEVKVGMNLNIPAIAFNADITISGGYSGKLVNETTTYSAYTNGISASMDNLVDTLDGIRIWHLKVLAYMLDPSKAHYWYLDSCGGQTPWYLAWTVSNAYQSIDLVSPSDKDRIDSTGAVFSWKPDVGELHDYTFYISRNPRVNGPNAIYMKKTGDETSLMVSDFKPEPGVTYYWRVRGVDNDKELIWSPTWKIECPALPLPRILPSLKTVVYPNPGKRDEIKLIISPESDGKVDITLTNLGGETVACKTITGAAKIPVTIGFEDIALPPGIYFASIKSGNTQTVKKVIIL